MDRLLAVKTSDRLSRPELILLLLYLPGATGKLNEPISGKTRLMKLLFLLSQEEKIDTYLSEKQAFVPFRYGPYDAEVYDDLAALKELNLITSEGPSAEGGDGEDEEISGDTYDVDTKFQLTQRGEAKATEILDTVPKDLIKRITNVKTAFGSMPLVELLHYVYRKYESYTTASDIRRKIMND